MAGETLTACQPGLARQREAGVCVPQRLTCLAARTRLAGRATAPGSG